MLKGEYRLARQGGGRGAFAHVSVEVVAWDGQGSQVITAVDPDDQLPRHFPEWFDAAREGCQAGLSALRDEGIETHSYQVRVRQLIYTIVDTTPEAVRAAAFLATAAAFNAQERFRLVFQDGWRVVPT
jgi:hypothetical protein